jgi:2-oxoglutarate ferredoxin oxidoreductase subunit alpha
VLPQSAQVLAVPFSRFAVRDLRRDLFKNSLGFGLLARVLSMDDAEAENCLRRRFRKLPEQTLASNIQALHNGFGLAREMGLEERGGLIDLPRGEKQERILISGNEATAFGFLAAGGRFFAGYPITPATEILDWLTRRLPDFGGLALQAEDELAAINLAIGAAMTGTRAMTASSGPGIALMQESVGHCGSAEIPLVIVDCQRAGPSTGMPTKTEQSDIGMLTQGANGDFPRVTLCPSGPNECFELAVLATNLAQAAQCPVIIALDRTVSQDSMTVPAFDLESVWVDNGERLSAARVRALQEYRRYRVTESGISPWAVPGTPGAMHLVTGNERNEWGHVSTEPKNRKTMMDKRARKVEFLRERLPRAVEWGDPQFEVGLIGVGMEAGVIDEARERLSKGGVKVRCHRPRTLSPLLDETPDFVRRCGRAYVIEHNESGQLARLITGAGAPADKIRSIRRYDGTPFRPGDLVSAILEREEEA